MTDLCDFSRLWHDASGREAAKGVLRDAAHDMIRAKGLDEFNMRALAKRVGVSPMAAYRYYACKETLVEDVRVQIRLSFAAHLKAAAGETSDPHERFGRLCVAYIGFALLHEQDYRLMFGSTMTAASSADPALVDTSAWRILLDTLSELSNSDDRGNVLDQAHLVWSTLHGLVMLHLSRRLTLGRSIEDLAAPLPQFLLSALHAV